VIVALFAPIGTNRGILIIAGKPAEVAVVQFVWAFSAQRR
jgi:uncharacterized membrane protein